MKRQIQYLFLCFFLLVIFIAPSRLLAAPYYGGKLLTIVVGYTPGSGYDLNARILAKYLPNYIPGKPTIIVQNMPGAGSMIAANYLYNQAKPDGLTVGAFARSLPLSQLIKAPGIKFDLTKFSWIGSPIVQAIVLVIRNDLSYKTFDDLLKAKEPINLGGTGISAIDSIFPLILKEYLGLKVNVIQYKGGSDINLALESKELDGRACTYSAAKAIIARGLVHVALRGVASEPGIEKVPVNVDFAKNEKAKRIMTSISVIDKLGQPYVAPPGTPIDRMNILREAFSKWAEDPQVQKETNKVMLTPIYVSAEESLKVVNYVLDQPPEIVEELRKYVKF